MSKARQLAQKPSQPTGRKNMIINGGMTVAARGTSFTAQTSQFVVDRFWYNSSGVATMDLDQSSDAPDGFSNSAKLTLNAVDSSIGSTDYYQLTHKIEGQNMAHLDWGSSSAKTVTISFWVKSSVAGDFPLRFINSDGSRSYATYVTINATDTWEYKTKVIPGPTDGTFLTTSGTGIEIGISFAAGSNYTGATADQWNTVSVFASSNLVNNTGWIGTTDNTFQITGVQLEAGSVATEFEHRSFGEELALCQRYFETMGHRIGSNTYSDIWSTPLNTFTNMWADFRYKVRKRTSPTVTKVSGNWQLGDGGSSPEFNDDSVDALVIHDQGFFYLDLVAEGQHCLEVDAEL